MIGSIRTSPLALTPKEGSLAKWRLIEDTDGVRFRAREAAQLQGKLVHVATIFPLVRPFVRSIAYFECSFKDPRAKLRLPSI
jgi:hypothetical protein